MARLGKHLRFFIRRKIAEDPLWQKPTVIFSGTFPNWGVRMLLVFPLFLQNGVAHARVCPFLCDRSDFATQHGQTYSLLDSHVTALCMRALQVTRCLGRASTKLWSTFVGKSGSQTTSPTNGTACTVWTRTSSCCRW